MVSPDQSTVTKMTTNGSGAYSITNQLIVPEFNAMGKAFSLSSEQKQEANTGIDVFSFSCMICAD